MKLALLDTCPYYTLKPNEGKQIFHTEFGGRFIELEGNEDFPLTVELIVEMFLDRIKMNKVVPFLELKWSNRQYSTSTCSCWNRRIRTKFEKLCSTFRICTILVIPEISTRKKTDRYSQISLLSTSEFTFRFYLSIAEIFVKNWIKFPVSLIASNVERISELLNSNNHSDFEQSNGFSLRLLQETKEALECVNSVVVEIIRFVFCLFLGWRIETRCAAFRAERSFFVWINLFASLFQCVCGSGREKGELIRRHRINYHFVCLFGWMIWWNWWNSVPCCSLIWVRYYND